MNEISDVSLYDGCVLQKIDWDLRKANFKNGVSVHNPGENLKIRPLALGDYDRGFLQILAQLTSIGDVSRELFEARFNEMKSCRDTYFVTVIEDTQLGVVIGAATLVVEQKFIHSAGSRGRIEDVVVNEEYRGKQLGKLLVETLTLLSRQVGCYKVSLECKPENIKFYESFGYKPDGQSFMVLRYDK